MTHAALNQQALKTDACQPYLAYGLSDLPQEQSVAGSIPGFSEVGH